METSCDSAVRCAIILAGGEGKRIRPFVQRLRGDTLPKQYVNFIGTRSMLEHTHHRAEMLFLPERVFTIISEDHMKYIDVCRQLLHRPKENVIIQPQNKDTGPGLLLPLMHLIKTYPESVVAIFPSDHFVLEEDLFMGYVDLACRAVERDPDQMVLLGVDPNAPDPEYGYILPDEAVNFPAVVGMQRVSRFIEKPGAQTADELVQKGGLWNTMVMIFQTRKLLGLIRRMVPALYHPFRHIGEALGTAQEKTIVKKIYRMLKPWNISKGLLEILPTRNPLGLSVLPVRGVFWSDWGSESRIVSDLKKFGYETRFHECSIHDSVA